MCLTLVRLTVVSPTRFRHVDPLGHPTHSNVPLSTM